MAVDLLFGETGVYTPPPGNAVNLLFGDTLGVPGVLTDASLVLPLRLRLQFTVGAAVLAAGHRTRAAWGAADRVGEVRAGVPWAPASSALAPQPVRLPWSAGVQARAFLPLLARWGRAAPRDRRDAMPWKRSGLLSTSPAMPWQSAAFLDVLARADWGAAAPLRRRAEAAWGAAQRVSRDLRLPWGTATYLPGVNRPLPPGEVNPGIKPTVQRVNLHFCVPAADGRSTDLLFGYENCITQPRLPDGLSIGARSSYVTTHNITAYRLPDLTPVPITSFTLNANADEFGWSLSATGPDEVRGLLEPTPGGVPKGLRLTIDGMTWEFVVESVRRNRKFREDSTTISARSITALLGDPYQPVQAFLNAVPMTAQQLVEEALAFTGATLDWQIDDWLVPTGAWSVTATPLAAALGVAAAVGAVVQSHRTLPQLIVSERYPVMPWDWGGVVPDVTIAAEALDSEGYERADRPEWEGVYVSGQAQGVLALVKRTGTAPAITKPLITDPLITESTAARLRGRSELGAGGPQARMTETIPVLTGSGEPGIVNPGRFVEVLDPAGAWTGLVRAVSVEYRRPMMNQTLAIERHL